MSRRIGIDEHTEQVVVSFRFDRQLKDRVKALPGSRYHGATRTWRFPFSALERVMEALVPHGFTCDWVDDAPGTTPPLPAAVSAPLDAAERRERPAGPASLSVRELNDRIRTAIARGFQGAVWVDGVVSSYDRNRPQGHAWFELVDAESDTAQTTISAVVFATQRERIARAMAKHGVELADGLSVRLRGRVEFYAPRGTVQFVVEDVDAAHSAGDLALRRERVLAELARRGLSERQRILPMPIVPLRVALVTSYESDAYFDVVSGLQASGFGFSITPFDVRVQGTNLSRSVCAALAAIAARAAEFDVVVVTRGGGSRVELGAWDDVAVAVAVAELPVKVLVAIGHQQDASALDAIATSAKTPTEAGERLAALARGSAERASALGAAVARAAEARVSDAHLRARTDGGRFAAAVRARLARERGRIDHLPRLLSAATLTALADQRATLRAAERRLQPTTLRRATARPGAQLDRLAARTARAAERATRAQQRTLDHAEHRLRLVHPDNVLKRGFAILRDADGAPLSKLADLPEGSAAQLQMADGTADILVNARRPPNHTNDRHD